YQELINSEEFVVQNSLRETESRANYLTDYFQEAEVILTNLRSVIINLSDADKFDRELVNKMILSNLNIRNNTLSLWVLLEPNAFDSDQKSVDRPGTRQDGRYAPWFYYNAEKTAIIQNICSTDQQKFYEYPQKLKREVLLEPYQTENGGDKFFITLAQPIIKNTFKGALGVDWFWEDFNKLVSKKPLNNRGNSYLISSSGKILSHNKYEKLGGTISDEIEEHLLRVKAGEKIVEHIHSEGFYRVITRFKIPYTESQWFIVNEIPDTNNFYTVVRQNKFFWRVGLFLLVLFLLLLYIVMDLLDFLVKDRQRLHREFSGSMDAAYEGRCIIDENYNYRQCNNAFKVAIKYLFGHEIVEGDSALEKVPDKFREINKANFDKALAGNYFIDEQEHQGRRYRHYYNPILNEENKAMSFAVRIVDITNKEKDDEEKDNYRTYLQSTINDKIADLQSLVEAIKDARLKQVENEKSATLGLLSMGLANELSNQVNFVVGNITPLRKDLEEVYSLLAISTKKDELEPEEYLRLLAQHLQKLEPEVLMPEIDTLVTGIENGAVRVLEIVNNFNEFVRPDRQARFENLNRGLELAIGFIRPQIPPAVQIIMEADPSLPSTFCDIGKLNDTFLTLLNFACKGTQKGNVTVATSSNDLESIVIRIANDVKKLSKEEIEMLFDPFLCVKGEPADDSVSLALCNKIIEAHGGTLKVKNLTEDKGLVFIIKIPILLRPQTEIITDRNNRNSGQ
ncbi:MAG: ATP-binding protein, partial [Cyclobacteriaceae bacterium]